MPLTLKPGVDVRGLRIETLLAVLVFYDLIGHTATGLTITSVMDGKHKEGSKHYSGFGFDVRTRDMEPNFAKWAATTAQERLGDQYDVVLESDHIHVEFDPKTPSMVG